MEAWESLGETSRLPQGIMGCQSDKSPVSDPSQKQICLELFNIMRFHITNHLTQGFFCLAGIKSFTHTSLMPSTFLFKSLKKLEVGKKNPGFLTLSSIIFSWDRLEAEDGEKKPGFFSQPSTGLCVRTLALPKG